MKKIVSGLAALCVWAGCAGPDPTLKVGVQSPEGVPLKVGIKAEEALPVKVDMQSDKALTVQLRTGSGEGVPVKLDLAGGESLPVELRGQSDKAVPVKVEMLGSRALPVEMKMTRRPLILSMVPVGVSLAAAVAACAAAWAAWLSAHRFKLAAESRLFFTQMHECASEQMYNALRRLSEWGATQGQQLAEQELSEKARDWKKRLDAGDQEAIEIDLARRRVSFYFSSVLLLKRLRHIRRHFLRGYDVQGTKRILDAVLYLHREKDITEDKVGYQTLKKDFEELIDWLDVRKSLVINR